MSSGNENNNQAGRGNRVTSRTSSSPPSDQLSPGNASVLTKQGTGRQRFHPYSQGDRVASKSSRVEKGKQEVEASAEHDQRPPQELATTSSRAREAELEASVAQYRTEAEEARQAYGFSLLREKKLDREIERLKGSEGDSVRERELRQEIERLKGSEESSVREREKLRQEIEKLQKKARGLVEERDGLKKQLRDANSDVTDLILEAEGAQGGRRLAEQEIKDKDAEIKEMEERLNGATAEIEQLKEQLANAENNQLEVEGLRRLFREDLYEELLEKENLRYNLGQQVREQSERAEAALAENEILRGILQERTQTILGLNARLEPRLSPPPRAQPPAPAPVVGPTPDPAPPASAPAPAPAPTLGTAPLAPAAAALARQRRQPARACKGKVRSYKEPRT